MKQIIFIVSLLCLSLSQFTKGFENFQLMKESNEFSDIKSGPSNAE